MSEVNLILLWYIILGPMGQKKKPWPSPKISEGKAKRIAKACKANRRH